MNGLDPLWKGWFLLLFMVASSRGVGRGGIYAILSSFGRKLTYTFLTKYAIRILTDTFGPYAETPEDTISDKKYFSLDGTKICKELPEISSLKITQK